MNKKRIEGDADQGEQPGHCKALVVTKVRRRRSDGRAVKECVLTRGDLALRLKGRREMRREKSAEAVVVTRRRAERAGELVVVSLDQPVHPKRPLIPAAGGPASW